VTALQAAGADVVLLPPVPSGSQPVPDALLDRLEGLLLPGGADVNPQRYGQVAGPALGEVDDDLDTLELSLVHLAADCGLPLLGICRGQQVVNVAFGGTLFQDLPAEGRTRFPHATPPEKGRDHLAHEIEIHAGTRLREIMGTERLKVNSFHHQAVRQVAPGLRVSAVSAVDGVIEGLESADGRIVTIQCHPEELTALAWARTLFEAFVMTAAGIALMR
jgi:putative glutamine amidotransferase